MKIKSSAPRRSSPANSFQIAKDDIEHMTKEELQKNINDVAQRLKERSANVSVLAKKLHDSMVNWGLGI